MAEKKRLRGSSYPPELHYYVIRRREEGRQWGDIEAELAKVANAEKKSPEWSVARDLGLVGEEDGQTYKEIPSERTMRRWHLNRATHGSHESAPDDGWPSEPAVGSTFVLDKEPGLCPQAMEGKPIGRIVDFKVDFGKLKPQEVQEKIAAQALDLRSEELVVLRFRLLDDLDVLFSGRGRWNSRRWVGLATPAYGSSTEFRLWGSEKGVLVRVKNPLAYEQNQSRAVFQGWSVKVEPAKCPEGASATAIYQGWT